MKKLLSGRRYLSLVGALVVVAVICLCAGSMLLVLDYRSQLTDTRNQLHATQEAFRGYQTGVYQRCLDRVPYDQKTDAWKARIQDYYVDLHENILSNENAQAAFYRRLITRVNAIIAAGTAALSRPSDAGCAKLKPPNGG